MQAISVFSNCVKDGYSDMVQRQNKISVEGGNCVDCLMGEMKKRKKTK
jgi:hypothetical protein